MTLPRILITTYHQAFLVRGGGEYEMFAIADSLKRKGYIVDIYSPYSRSLENYDVIIHFSVHGGGIDLLREVQKSGKPIILWPNLWVTDIENSIEDLVNTHVEMSDAVVFKSKTELTQFDELFSLPSNKAFLTLFGADPSYTRGAPEGLFKELYGIENYAIWFGVIESRKNQMAAIKVLSEKEIPLVLVGRYREKNYYDKCRSLGQEKVMFIDGLPQRSEIVRSALQDAMFYIEVPFEPPGLSAIEAGLSGCSLLLSESEWAREHFGDMATYADPSDPISISNAVDVVQSSEHDKEKLVNRLKKHCLPGSIEPLEKIIKSIAN